MEAFICIQCRDRFSGKTGTFLTRDDPGKGPFGASSPVFISYFGLLAWMNANGWRKLPNENKTGRVWRDV